MDRLLLNCNDDCFVENLGTTFCRFRKASFGGFMDGRAAIARVDVESERVQVRADRRNMSMTIGSFFVRSERGMAFS